ncbi:rabphilin-3A isoform X1 [Camponotus floridanus]|uniref:rabphilin-3A isoform X1 n=1 Tax=Camponotus floridanus TaxID=104421 RepID=UPI00059C27B1|nr:rabphilin-3A isoform X1 [Camponotus floridanus]XP_011268186.1 rabphilin-3A isoform X1 [Camponotus floridanus]XP_011268187.1 rabphilin-3A isoform X1 [Camponotus floridanus]XP_011268188.1 rabphilin-3A isoform X1 [Camponotus floridanus]XP_011268189.1 rabphilin-3A isoform X1 [Camponotus floridanus]XP_025269315.1 rabphilin-3A isoform X1 [Camponotus floridanus]XP_025269316.1 rabphilin-3A isoform X1 [Camponotus floridanus]
MDERITRGGRWVCPNDRHLALRAKLRTGWSVKTGSFESHGWGEYPNSYISGSNRCGQPFLLSEDERQSIIQVIQRAEALDLSEQERVGRLVERLENMKRNVCIVTSTRSNERRGCGSRCSGGARCVCSCALCGEKFGTVLGASANLCKDCHRYICQKCGIEATRLNLPKGSGDRNDTTASSRSSLRLMRIAQERMAVQRIVQRSHGNAQKQFLCRICAETREMWKKSGAWFFKGMPKYILPEKKERGWSRPSHRTSTWTISRSLDSTDAQDSSSDDDATRRLAVTRGHSISPTNLSSNREGTPTKLTVSSPATSTSSPKSPRGRPNGLSPSGYREDAGSDRLDKSCLSIASQCSRLSPTGSISTPRSRTSGRSPSGLQTEQHVSFENIFVDDEKANEADDDEEEDSENSSNLKDATTSLDRSKSTQVQSLRLKTPTITMSPMTPTTPVKRFQTMSKILERNTERDANKSCSTQDSSSSGTRSNSQIKASRTPEYPKETGQDYGTLEVSLRYDPADQCLQCKVERARRLIPMDIQGLADPFCKLNILPVEKVATSSRLRTKTVHKTRDPEFNETVNFYGTTETDISSGKVLHILIIQDDPSGQDFLGEAKFPLHELQPYQTKHYKVPLQAHYPVDNEEEIWGMCSSGRGQIQISLSYCTRRRALLVTVHRATNLLPMDNNGFSDPFVKLALVEDATDNHRQQRFLDFSTARATAKKLKKTAGRNSQSTSIKRKTLNPEWNEEFVFATRLTELMKLTLCLSVWDKDFGKSNDYLGGLMLGCSSKGARLRHWIDAIKFPDHRHLAWHNLAEMDVPME